MKNKVKCIDCRFFIPEPELMGRLDGFCSYRKNPKLIISNKERVCVAFEPKEVKNEKKKES